jgi:hypothetical protein
MRFAIFLVDTNSNPSPWGGYFMHILLSSWSWSILIPILLPEVVILVWVFPALFTWSMNYWNNSPSPNRRRQVVPGCISSQKPATHHMQINRLSDDPVKPCITPLLIQQWLNRNTCI